MEEIMQKIEEVLGEKQDPFFLVFEHETGSLTEFYINNEEGIKGYIEQVISERELTLWQLYNLILIYFKDDVCSQEAIEYLGKLISYVKINLKNLKLLKTLIENIDEKDYLERMLPELSIALLS